jgi:LysM repeat protein
MVRAVILGFVVLSTVGCTTLQTQQRAESDARMAMTMRDLTARLQQLEVQVDSTTAARDDMYQRLDDVQAGMDAQSRRYSDRINDLEARVVAEGGEREAMRKALVDQLTKQVTQIVERHVPSQPAQSGYEHTVRRGETLSAIAQAYGTTIGAIKKSNRLKSDRIRVDQKLFIPE